MPFWRLCPYREQHMRWPSGWHDCPSVLSDKLLERRPRKSMTHPSVHVQIAPPSVPSTPSWLGEVAVLAHVFSQLGLQRAIEERVRFTRTRVGGYEGIHFVVMLLDYAV